MHLDFERINLGDAEKLFDLRNDCRIYKWCRQYAPIHFEDHLKWIDKQRKDPTIDMFKFSGPYMINEPDCYSAIYGVCGLTDIDHINSRAEFSLYVDPNRHNSGIGRKALAWLLNYGFNVLNINLIWGETYNKNPAIKLFDKMGMSQDGVRRQFYFREGEYIDAILYSITRDEFNGSDYHDS